MAEWLTHVLVAYALFTPLTWAVSRFDERWVAVAMVGSIIPDLGRISLVVSDGQMAAILGLPFDWSGVHTLAGIALLSTVGALVVRGRRRQVQTGAILACGALTHILVDLPQRYADGKMLTNLYLYPLPPWRPPTPGWYVSPDVPVVVVAVALALPVFVLDIVLRQDATNEGGSDD